MSSIIVVTPLMIAGWPAITAAVTAAVASMGFNVAQSTVAATPNLARRPTRSKVDIALDDSEILQGSRGEQIVVQRDGIQATFSRDERGALKVCMEGDSVSHAELRRIGEELVDRVTQQFVYHRVVTELKARGMSIVDEQQSQDRTVKIRVRNL